MTDSRGGREGTGRTEDAAAGAVDLHPDGHLGGDQGRQRQSLLHWQGWVLGGHVAGVEHLPDGQSGGAIGAGPEEAARGGAKGQLGLLRLDASVLLEVQGAQPLVLLLSRLLLCPLLLRCERDAVLRPAGE